VDFWEQKLTECLELADEEMASDKGMKSPTNEGKPSDVP
jgi:hypothetical protein